MTPEGQNGGSYKLSLNGEGIKVDRVVDASTAAEILQLVMGGVPSSNRIEATSSKATRSSSRPRRKAKIGAAGDSKPKVRRKAGSSPGIVRDLSLRPKGKKAFADFAAEKAPKTHQEKQVVIVHWLRHEAGLTSGITPDHVNSCYLDAGWPRPNDLVNALHVTAARKGWLDTSTKDDITITTRGEDEVNHKLPRPAKKSK